MHSGVLRHSQFWSANHLSCDRKDTVNGKCLQYLRASPAGIGEVARCGQRALGVHLVPDLQGLSSNQPLASWDGGLRYTLIGTARTFLNQDRTKSLPLLITQ